MSAFEYLACRMGNNAQITPPYLGIMERPKFSQAPALTGDGGQSDDAGKSEKIKDEEKELKKKRN